MPCKPWKSSPKIAMVKSFSSRRTLVEANQVTASNGEKTRWFLMIRGGAVVFEVIKINYGFFNLSHYSILCTAIHFERCNPEIQEIQVRPNAKVVWWKTPSLSD